MLKKIYIEQESQDTASQRVSLQEIAGDRSQWRELGVCGDIDSCNQLHDDNRILILTNNVKQMSHLTINFNFGSYSEY